MRLVFVTFIFCCCCTDWNTDGTDGTDTDNLQSDTGNYQTDYTADTEIQTTETTETDCQNCTSTDGTQIDSYVATETETETEIEKETGDPDTAVFLADCEAAREMIVACLGAGSQYQRISDACEFNMFDPWAVCMIHCNATADCTDFLICAQKEC